MWQFIQPTWAKISAPSTASGLSAKPWSWAQVGTSARFSSGSGSSAVAPLYVRTPIEAIVSSAATIATGRRSGRRSRLLSRNGNASSRMSAIVGMPTVPRTTDSGHLKIRSR